MPNFPKKLQSKLASRIESGAFRKLSKQADKVDFSSNDYLGLAREIELSRKALKLLINENLDKNGATGSRLLTGNHPLFEKLELNLADLLGSESALVFNSGYDANIGFFSSIPQRGDVIFYDEFIHASIRDGINLGNAKSYKFKHNDLEDLKLKCQTLRQNSEVAGLNNVDIYVVTEAIFSMDGDSPDLIAFANFCTEYKIHLIVDEAHSFGVYGKRGEGLVKLYGLENQVFARIITFGKAIGCHGAAIVCSARLKDYLINFCRSFIYTTAMPPHAIASIIIALEFLNTRPGIILSKELFINVDYFLSEIKNANLIDNFIPCRSAIQSFLVQGNERARFLAHKLQEKGFDVKPIVSPTVPEGKERLRFCIHSYNTKEEISECFRILAKFS
ncbi:8-amino-7-oxononanoate synthase [Aurantibacter crassamenti]|uniref:aminotransferase class I/II-fold pyridoxal phosphate-dependent enzyme n=1 Tax=Aurantibacter crassamenti TaxID=1837375 RepID=UPI00193A7D5A|nr:8-amino-7-oxononanoate synthase [Aurantibacter crassamenti]MBM1104862.1 8-amino-7-oxononanoate synthase [Aurantibacter crassamenti]